MLAHHVRVSPPKVIVVEYDCREARKQKTFTDTYAARRFYISKDKAGKTPKIVSASR